MQVILAAVTVVLVSIGVGTTSSTSFQQAVGASPSFGVSTKTVCPPSPTSIPPVAKVPWPSLVYVRSGLELVGVSPLGAGYEGGKPSELYMSTDMVHWREVTPSQSQVSENCSYPFFEHASFLNAFVGWVTSWNPATTSVTIYRTTNGGRSWTAIPGGAHSAHAGATIFVQLLSPRIAFKELLEPTGPGMSLAVTTDAGVTWRTVYRGPPPTRPGQPVKGPFELPIVFQDTRRGFGADGIPPPLSATGEGDLFATSDGGSTWVRESPPSPRTSHTCPRGVGLQSAPSCYFGLPFFRNSFDGVLPTEVVFGSTASVGFDVTTDGGSHWLFRAERSATDVAPALYESRSPLVSVASDSSWWVVGWKDGNITTQVTADAGAHWRSGMTTLTDEVPASLSAVDASRALMTVEHITSEGTSERVVETVDGGRNWQPLRFL